MGDAAKTISGPRARHLALALLAFLSIFFVYFIGSTQMLPGVDGILPKGAAGGSFVPNPAREARDLLIWWSSAAAGLALSIATAAWCVLLLRKHCPRRVAAAAIALFSIFSLLGAAAAYNAGNSMVQAVQHFACPALRPASEAPLICLVPDPSIEAGQHNARDRPGAGRQVSAHKDAAVQPSAPRQADEQDPRAAFAAAFGRMKTLLNVMLQMAAVFLLGTLLTVCAITYDDERENERHREKLRSGRVFTHLFMAAGAVLSTIVLTDILYSNWPANAFSAGAAPRGMAEMLSVMTLYFAVLSTIVLVLTLVAARALAGPSLPFTLTGDGTSGFLAGTRKFLLRRSTINALVALSPILTVAAGNPLMQAIIGALPGS